MRLPDANSASVALPPLEELSAEIQTYLDRTRERFSLDFDPTMGRVISAIPEIWRGEAHASRVAYGPGLFDIASKEMIAACVSAMNACDY